MKIVVINNKNKIKVVETDNIVEYVEKIVGTNYFHKHFRDMYVIEDACLDGQRHSFDDVVFHGNIVFVNYDSFENMYSSITKEQLNELRNIKRNTF